MNKKGKIFLPSKLLFLPTKQVLISNKPETGFDHTNLIPYQFVNLIETH
jgi:hypothetical protein